MRFKVQEVVRGATKFDGEIDGKVIKSGQIYMDVSLDKDGRGYGFRTREVKVADLDLIDSISKGPFPFLAEIDFEEIAGRKTSELVVVGIKRLPVQAKAA